MRDKSHHPATRNAATPKLESRGRPIQRYKPDERQCALLTLALIEAKEVELGRSISRCRVAEISLKRLWCRNRITPQFFEAVCDWLGTAGVVMFYAGASYGLVRVTIVESWTRLTSKRLDEVVQAVAAGTYDFDQLDRLMQSDEAVPEDHQEG